MKKAILSATFLVMAFVGSAFTNGPAEVSVKKPLVFPVAGKKAYVGSFWGDVRDGGKRRHEGIDIFARKGTPVVAICDGVVTSRTTTPRGGRIIWLRAIGRPWTVYYAHLDQWKVRRGQYVKRGQVIGTVGNTGNARTTPAHLHFGIYTKKGAVNPLPYVKNAPKISVPSYPKSSGADVAKSTKRKKTVSKDKTVAAPVLPKSSIARVINIPSDPASRYFVTTRSNVVRVRGGRLQVIGKWKKAGPRYPYKIELSNERELFVSQSGRLLTADGVPIGRVS